MRNLPGDAPKRIAWMVLAALLAACGCQQKMAMQPSFDDFQPCEFFKDGTTAQRPPEGTVARGHLRLDRALYTGRVPQKEFAAKATDQDIATESAPQGTDVLAAEAQSFEGVVDAFPLAITREIVEHGRNRYMIYCVVCHDPLGSGHGKIVERGYTRPPSYHIDRLRQTPVGHFFRVVSEGYGSMPSYAAQIPVRDRWAIVAYIRALQLSQHFPENELPESLPHKWQQSTRRQAED